MPLEFVLPLGFRPRALVSKIFSAVRVGGKWFTHKSRGSHKLPAADERGSRAAPSPSCAQAGGEGGGSRGAAHLPPPPVPRMDGWNSSLMPARGRGLLLNPHPPGSFFYEPPTGRSLHNDGGDDDNNKWLITVITKPAPAAPGLGVRGGAGRRGDPAGRLSPAPSP